MTDMNKITTGTSYVVSGGSFLFWLKNLLNGFSPEQWTAIGVLGSLFLAFLTVLVNWYYKRKDYLLRERRRKYDGKNK